MSDSQGLLENTGEMGETNRDDKIKKLKFTPPILHEYGEVVKICRAAPLTGQNDFFTQNS
jgi:hypothetical protein